MGCGEYWLSMDEITLSMDEMIPLGKLLGMGGKVMDGTAVGMLKDGMLNEGSTGERPKPGAIVGV